MARSPGWTVLGSRDVLDASPYLKVRVETIELPDGRCIPDYYQLEMPSFACIFAETLEGLIVVYRQYRHGPRRVGLVFPGGHLEPGEAPLVAARRELVEETGFESEAWTYLGRFVVNANQGAGVSHMFHATGCRRTGIHEFNSDFGSAQRFFRLCRRKLFLLACTRSRRRYAGAAFGGRVATPGLCFPSGNFHHHRMPCNQPSRLCDRDPVEKRPE